MSSQRRWTILWVLLAISFFLLFAHRAWFIPETDYVAYYQAGFRALQGENLYRYESTPFKYLPGVAYLFIPFSILPFQISKFIFFVLSYLIGIWIYRQVYKRYGHGITLLTFVAMIRFHNYDFLNSQVNHLLLGFLIFFLWYRKSYPVIGSSFFAILTCFKVMPVLVLPILLLQRQLKDFLTVGFSLLVLLLVPLLTFHEGIQVYSNWYELLKNTTEFPAPAGSILQSLQAALWYWVTSLHSAPQLFVVLSVLLQLIIYVYCLKAACQESEFSRQNEIILAGVILSVVFSPLAWKHNYLLLLPIFPVLLSKKQYVWAGVSFFLMTGVSAIVGIFSIEWADRSYATLLGAFVLFAYLIKKSQRIIQ